MTIGFFFQIRLYTKYFLCSALFSLGLLLDGILYYIPKEKCYQEKLIWGLFIVPIIISFYSVLGLAIERFQTFALYQQDRRKLTRGFSVAWSFASWTLAICLLVILLSNFSPLDNNNTRNDGSNGDLVKTEFTPGSVVVFSDGFGYTKLGFWISEMPCSNGLIEI